VEGKLMPGDVGKEVALRCEVPGASYEALVFIAMSIRAPYR